MKGTYKIADKIILIDSVRDGIHKFCREYACEGAEPFRIRKGGASNAKRTPVGVLCVETR